MPKHLMIENNVIHRFLVLIDRSRQGRLNHLCASSRPIALWCCLVASVGGGTWLCKSFTRRAEQISLQITLQVTLQIIFTDLHHLYVHVSTGLVYRICMICTCLLCAVLKRNDMQGVVMRVPGFVSMLFSNLVRSVLSIHVSA